MQLWTTHNRVVRRFALLAALICMTTTSSGCTYFNGLTLLTGFAEVMWVGSEFWGTTGIIPVTSYMSNQIEDTYWEEERYGRTPILDPVEGEFAPLFCLDPPTPDEVTRALPETITGGVPFFAETFHNNVRMVVEPIVDDVGECRFYPLVGPARLHKCHYKCTVYFDKTIRSGWPVPYEFTDDTTEVVYIDHDHLIRCAGPQAGDFSLP
ncbi:hypothetical protein [Calycomorphotria hydatis]|uniref:Uncharacterized protein n=1 Tax=Calycomorphotria hydatis TaxID=2528027 RepID=A0A517TC16_9PLAN|nr:hypothetical protein [Calycomorphotria hydatis]QDT65911.1 hypothetical protein V22_31740 [Calycomorphotria hydatis]